MKTVEYLQRKYIKYFMKINKYLYDKKKLLRPHNTDGWGNKLVTIFARHLDCFIVTLNFSLICQIRDFGSGQILQPRQFYLSPRLAKIAPYPPRHRDSFSAKVPGSVAGWLRRVTFTPSTAGPSDCLKTYPYS